ncbi:MAG: translation initiation factor IF-3 [Bacteroidota bacterium]|nr:translation initiation factor IF-3 [Bacteroidota bacterium]
MNRKKRTWNKPEEKYKINDKITSSKVRVVGDNVEVNVYPLHHAKAMAERLGLDLVEISPNTDPPVCKIIDYSKFKYTQKKKQKSIRSNAQKIVLKEIRFGPNTDEHDFNFKLKHAIKFLENGAKVKAYVHFYGRTIVFKERGEILLLKLAQALENIANVEELPKLEGKRMFLMLSPKK